MKSTRIAIALAILVAATTTVAQSDAVKTFDQLKTLNGTWEGKSPKGDPFKVIFRPTANGSALMSEILSQDDMITMFHMDNNRVLATHYCGAGNQPRMVASSSADGKTITFNFVDVTNLATPKSGHMDHFVITMVDPDHHTEDWTFVQDGKEMRQHFELSRAKTAGL